MDKILDPSQPVRCIITGLSEYRKIFFLAKLILNVIEYDKKYIYSPSLHEDLCQTLINCFSNYIPKNKIPKILNEDDLDVAIDEIVNIENFGKSEER